MSFHQARLLATAVGPDKFPDHKRTEVALCGRSNVGKSSLINALVPMKRLAYVSKRPGRTQTINFYALDERLCLVDLPGYGYAQVPQAVRARWGPMIEGYLRNRPQLCAIFHLIDGRHGPTRDDLHLWSWLQEGEFTAIPIATKWDKVRPKERVKRTRAMTEALGQEPLLFSSVTLEGREKLIDRLRAMAK